MKLLIVLGFLMAIVAGLTIAGAMAQLSSADEAKPAAAAPKPDTVVIKARVTEDLSFVDDASTTYRNRSGKIVPRPDADQVFRYDLSDLYIAANIAAEWVRAHPDAKGVHFGARIRPDGVTVLMVGQDALVAPRPNPSGK